MFLSVLFGGAGLKNNIAANVFVFGRSITDELLQNLYIKDFLYYNETDWLPHLFFIFKMLSLPEDNSKPNVCFSVNV